MPGTMETSVIATQSGWAKLPPPGLGGHRRRQHRPEGAGPCAGVQCWPSYPPAPCPSSTPPTWTLQTPAQQVLLSLLSLVFYLLPPMSVYSGQRGGLMWIWSSCEISSQPLALAAVRAQLTPAVLRPCMHSRFTLWRPGWPVSGVARTDQAWGTVPTPVGSFS